MDETESDPRSLSTKSLFDVIEKNSANPENFCWTKLETAELPEKGPKLHEGVLLSSRPCSPEPVPRHYVLTYRLLIKFKKHNSSVPASVLWLKNPRIETTEDQSHGRRGFRLVGYGGTQEFHCEKASDRDQWLKQLKKVGVQFGVARNYTFGKLVGKGNFANVCMAKQLDDGQVYAIKSIDKSKVLAKSCILDSVQREIAVLRESNHPSIVKLFEVYEDDLYVHLVLEYLSGGELFRKVGGSKVFSEKEIMRISKNVIEGLEYCHERSIVHRDIKPDNIVFASAAASSSVKIVDFGLATVVDPLVPERLKCGSPGYVAPEILEGHTYGLKVDIFSFGAILYTLLSGTQPFYASSVSEMLEKNRNGMAGFSESRWASVSSEARNLVERMLAKDPEKRLSAREALFHPWFVSDRPKKLGRHNTGPCPLKPVLCLQPQDGSNEPHTPHTPQTTSTETEGQSRKYVHSKFGDDKGDELFSEVVTNLSREEHPKCISTKQTPSKTATRAKREEEDDAADFNEKEMSESTVSGCGSVADVGILKKSIVPPMRQLTNRIPTTPGYDKNKRRLAFCEAAERVNTTPTEEGKNNYLLRLARLSRKSSDPESSNSEYLEPTQEAEKESSDSYNTARSHQSAAAEETKEESLRLTGGVRPRGLPCVINPKKIRSLPYVLRQRTHDIKRMAHTIEKQLKDNIQRE